MATNVATFDQDPTRVTFYLKKRCDIDKIILKHHENPAYRTSDYTVLGSNDKKVWKEIAQIQDNHELYNVMEIENARYKYVQFLFTKPNRLDNYFRIFLIEIWGK